VYLTVLQASSRPLSTGPQYDPRFSLSDLPQNPFLVLKKCFGQVLVTGNLPVNARKSRNKKKKKKKKNGKRKKS
jgi:hypothetical protein